MREKGNLTSLNVSTYCYVTAHTFFLLSNLALENTSMFSPDINIKIYVFHNYDVTKTPRGEKGVGRSNPVESRNGHLVHFHKF